MLHRSIAAQQPCPCITQCCCHSLSGDGDADPCLFKGIIDVGRWDHVGNEITEIRGFGNSHEGMGLEFRLIRNQDAVP